MRACISVTQQGRTLTDNEDTVFHMLVLMILFEGLCFLRFRRITSPRNGHWHTGAILSTP